MSTRIKKTKPLMRKQPTQARSRASVGAIVEAAARILSDQGWVRIPMKPDGDSDHQPDTFSNCNRTRFRGEAGRP